MPWKPQSHYELSLKKPAERAYNRSRDPELKRFYGGSMWRWVSSHVLAEEPICRTCKTAPATCVDHIVPVRERFDLRLDRSNLQPLCVSCHRKKTIEDKKSKG